MRLFSVFILVVIVHICLLFKLIKSCSLNLWILFYLNYPSFFKLMSQDTSSIMYAFSLLLTFNKISVLKDSRQWLPSIETTLLNILLVYILSFVSHTLFLHKHWSYVLGIFIWAYYFLRFSAYESFVFFINVCKIITFSF